MLIEVKTKKNEAIIYLLVQKTTIHKPAETKPCKVTIPIKIFSSFITGKN